MKNQRVFHIMWKTVWITQGFAQPFAHTVQKIGNIPPKRRNFPFFPKNKGVLRKRPVWISIPQACGYPGTKKILHNHLWKACPPPVGVFHRLRGQKNPQRQLRCADFSKKDPIPTFLTENGTFPRFFHKKSSGFEQIESPTNFSKTIVAQ